MATTTTTDQQKDQQTAGILTEALPYMRRFAGAVFVIKWGGHVMADPAATDRFASDVVLLNQVGIKPVIVHGGGPQIGVMLDKLEVKSQFVAGLRTTTPEAMDAVEMVLSGSLNKSLVSAINRHGGRAVGLSGKDGLLITARPVTRKVVTPGSHIEQHVDLGCVGEPVSINRDLLDLISGAGFIPVIAPVGAHEETYAGLNINADTVAGHVAQALGAKRLILLTDINGILDAKGARLTELGVADVAKLIADGTISEGMIPKSQTCVDAVTGGVEAAVIIDGMPAHALLIEVFTAAGFGTLIRA